MKKSIIILGIISLIAGGCKQAEQAENALEALEDMIVKTIKAYLNEDEETLNSFIHKDFGIAFLYRRGAFDSLSVAAKISFDAPVPEYMPYDTYFESADTVYFEELPVYSCDNDKWNKSPGI